MNVTVELTGTLVARTGTRRDTVAVPEGATLAQVVDALAARYGPQVRAGVLDGERVRSDTIVCRETADESEPLSTASRLEPGDMLRVSLAGA